MLAEATIHNPLAEDLAQLHERGYAREMPKFLDQCDPEGPPRDTKFSFSHYTRNPETGKWAEHTDTKTEHDGLIEFKDKLLAVVQQHGGQLDTQTPVTWEAFHDRKDPAVSEVARATAFLNNFNFVGEPEADSAAQIFAADWKSYLDDNPGAQLCIVTGELYLSDGDGGSDEYTKDQIKSDRYLLEWVLKHFSAEELERYIGGRRLCLDPSQLTADPKDVQIRGIDDRIISGQQMQGVGDFIAARYPQYADRLSIQLVLATEKQLDEGFQGVPLTAVYKARNALADDEPITRDCAALFSSLDSKADFVFWELLPKSWGTIALANIDKPYRRLRGPLPATKAAMELLAREPQAPQVQRRTRLGRLAMLLHRGHKR